MRKRTPLLFLLIPLLTLGLLVPSPASGAVSVSGYLKLDVQYSDKVGLGGLQGFITLPTVPLDTDKDRDNAQTFVDARASRLRAVFTDEIAGIKLSGMVEGDFFTTDGNALTSNSRHLRLRHAFARADHPSGFFLLAGQYSTLSNNEDIGFLGKAAANDVNGPVGSRNGARQPQLRVGW